jgi:hypothetical protein
MSAAPAVSVLLCHFDFGAKIDFVRIATPGKRDLPLLFGRPEWGIAAQHKELTIHDLDPRDIAALRRVFPQARVLGIEVAVDARPSRFVPDENKRMLEDGFREFARHLFPYQGPKLAEAKTAGFVPALRKPVPFNLRIPKPTEQLLFGFRDDQDAQVKVYLKVTDNRKALPVRKQCVRVEVAIKQGLCEELGIGTLESLLDFRFRQVLSPYFRMAGGVVAVKSRTERPVLKIVEARIADLRQADADRAWQVCGVQGVRGMKDPKVRFRRHSDLNRRIGKALQRLQDRYSRKNLVRRNLIGRLEAPVIARLYDACAAGRITTREPSFFRRLHGAGKGSATIVV